jgi:hypothetical protein
MVDLRTTQPVEALKRTLRSERGVVLVTVVVAVAVLLTLVVSVSSLASGETRATPYWRDRTEARYVAESGLNHCLWKAEYERDELDLAQGTYPNDPPTFTSTSEDESRLEVSPGVIVYPLPAGSYYEVWYKPDPVDTTKAAVTVLARAGQQSFLLNAVIRQKNPPFDEGGDKTGDKTEENFVMPPDNDNISYIHVSDDPYTLPAGTYVVDWVRFDGNAPFYITDDTVIWVKESIVANGTGIVNPDGDESVPPAERYNLIFYMPPVEGATVTISGTTDWNAYVYAPTAKVKVTGDASVFGVLVGETVKTNKYIPTPEGALSIGYPPTVITQYVVDYWGG